MVMLLILFTYLGDNMKKLLVKQYLYKKRIYLDVPKDLRVAGYKEIDGVTYGVLKKKSGLPEFLLLLWLLALCAIIYFTPDRKQIIQIPNEVYVMDGLLNVDVSNPMYNPYDAYVQIQSPSGDILYECILPAGESLGAIEIDTSFQSYIIEYKVKWNNVFDVSKKYKINNASYERKE